MVTIFKTLALGAVTLTYGVLNRITLLTLKIKKKLQIHTAVK